MNLFNPFKPHIWQSKKTKLFYIRRFSDILFTKQILLCHTDYYNINRWFEWCNITPNSKSHVKNICSYVLKEEASHMLNLYNKMVQEEKERQVL